MRSRPVSSSSSDTRSPPGIDEVQHLEDHEREHAPTTRASRPTATSWSPISSQLPLDEHALVHDRRVEGPVGEQPEQQRADEPADEVHADDVERVVVAEA